MTRPIFKYLLIILLLGGALLFWQIERAKSPAVSEKAPDNSQTAPFVQIGEAKIFVELAQTPAQRETGLSEKTSLQTDSGMLFIFPKADTYIFWMKNMKFPIDIIWINEGRVVDIDENVTDKFDPAHPNYYAPAKPAQYVLEISAGGAKTKNIKIGDSVDFHFVLK